jgi:hypothetical protein
LRVDIDALYAYLMTLPPIRYGPAPETLIFPANIRPLMSRTPDPSRARRQIDFRDGLASHQCMPLL